MMETEAPELSAVVEETSQAVDAPVAPDATAAPSPAGEEPAPDPQGTTASARPRDEHGRFTKQELAKQASDAAKEAVVPAVADAPNPPAPPPLPSVPKGDPFVFRADGQKIPVPGALLGADGALTIPPDQVPVIRQLLAEGVTYRGSWRQKEQEREREKEQAVVAERAKAEKYNNAAVILWDRVTQLLADNPQELALLRREMDLELRSADLKIPQVAQPKPAEPEPQQIEAAARAGLDEYLEELFESPLAKQAAFSDEEKKALNKRFQRRLAAYYVEHPEQKGQIALDTEIAREDFEDEIKQRMALRKQVDDKAKADAFNAKREATPVVQAPPVVSTKGTGSTSQPPKTFATREEWRKNMGIS